MKAPILKFPELAECPIHLAMTLRVPGLPVSTDKVLVMRALEPAMVAAAAELAPRRKLITAEQTHGKDVAWVASDLQCAQMPGVDGLLTFRDDVVLGIAVADCCPVWLWTADGSAMAVVHAGRKGAEAGIAAETAKRLCQSVSCPPSSLGAFLGPCIHPPHYEVDIPSLLHTQLADVGVQNCHDCALNTAADLERFYSYRREKGNTGRMLALGWKKHGALA